MTWKGADHKKLFLFLAERNLNKVARSRHGERGSSGSENVTAWSNTTKHECCKSIGSEIISTVSFRSVLCESDFTLAWYVNCARWDLCSHAVFAFLNLHGRSLSRCVVRCYFQNERVVFGRWPMACELLGLHPPKIMHWGSSGYKTSIVCGFGRSQLNRKQFFRCRPASSKREAGLGRCG